MSKQTEVSNLQSFSDALASVQEEKQKENIEWQKQLTGPLHFEEDPSAPGHGIGYWKASNGGVFSYRKYSNGYDRYSRVEYPNSLINILNKVSSMRVVDQTR